MTATAEITALDALTALGDAEVADGLVPRLDAMTARVNADVDATVAHEANKTNPHDVVAGQVSAPVLPAGTGTVGTATDIAGQLIELKTLADSAAAGGTQSDLGYTAAAGDGTVTNTGGADATLPAADGTNAGLMTSADKTKLDAYPATPTSGVTNLAYTAAPGNGVVTSDTGTDATVTVVDGTNAGLMVPADKSKLDTYPATSPTPLTDAQIKTQYEANADTNPVTDAEKTVLGNTSGTNTGDQTAATVPTAAIAGLAGGAVSDVQTILEGINAKADSLASVTGNFITGASTFAGLPEVDVDGTTAVENGDITLLDTVDGGNLKGLYIRVGGAWQLLVEVPDSVTVAAASTSVSGTTTYATDAETIAGTEANKATTPVGVKAAITDSLQDASEVPFTAPTDYTLANVQVALDLLLPIYCDNIAAIPVSAPHQIGKVLHTKGVGGERTTTWVKGLSAAGVSEWQEKATYATV